MKKNFTSGLILGLIIGILLGLGLCLLYSKMTSEIEGFTKEQLRESLKFVSLDDKSITVLSNNLIDSTTLFDANEKYQKNMNLFLKDKKGAKLNNSLTIETAIDMKYLLVALNKEFKNLIRVDTSQDEWVNYDLYLRVVPMVIDSSYLHINRIAQEQKLSLEKVKGRISYGVQIFNGKEDKSKVFILNKESDYYDFGQLCPPNCKPPK